MTDRFDGHTGAGPLFLVNVAKVPRGFVAGELTVTDQALAGT